MSVIRFEDIFNADQMVEHCKELAKLEQTGVCFYTDGGYRRTLPVPNASWGIHAFFYKEGKPKKSSRYKTHFPTKEGYTFAPEDRTSMVSTSKILNASGLIHLPEATNNIAELQAVILSVDILLKTELRDFIKTVRIFSDSKYVLDNLNVHMVNWKARGWKTSSGSPVLNLAYWKTIDAQLQELDTLGFDIVFEYRPGHVDFGNIIADNSCTLAMSTGIEIQDFCDEEWYFSNEIDINTLMIEQRYIHFPGLLEEYQEFAYLFSFTDTSIPISSLGCRLSDLSLSIIKIDEDRHVKDLKTIHRECVKIEDVTQPVPMVVELKNFLANRFNYFLKNDLITSLPQVVEIDKSTINDPVDNLPVVSVITPARNSFKLLDEYQQGVRILRETDNPDSTYVRKTDITDLFYKTNDKDKLEFVLKMEEAITVPAEHWSAGEVKIADVILTMGLDMPKRRVLFNLVDQKPKISVVTWELGEFSFRYGVLVETETSYGFWFSPYANTHLLM